jgi:hypothetical protein
MLVIGSTKKSRNKYEQPHQATPLTSKKKKPPAKLAAQVKSRAKGGLFKRSATALCFAGLLGVLRSLKATGGPICLARFDIFIIAGPHAKSLLVIVIDVAADALKEAVDADSTFA